jgi:hypothetical protein
MWSFVGLRTNPCETIPFMKGNGAYHRMKISNAPKYILGIFAAAGILAGCSSGSQSALAPSSGMQAVHGAQRHNGKLVTAFRLGVPQAHAFKSALVMPDKKSRKKFGYISEFDGSSVSEFHFPKGANLTNSISGDEPQGLCAEKGRGDFWVTNSGSETIVEYKANTTTEIASVSQAAYGDPAGCAVSDASSSKGEVAASLITGGDVVLYPNGTGSGTEVADALEETFFATFDDKGDLFVDGFNSEFIPAVAEMPAGSSTFHIVLLPNSIEFPGNIQWDGKYVTVNDQEAYDIYQYTVSGSSATLSGTVSYTGASDCDQTWIYKGHFLCPDAGDDNAKVYNYPAGGAPVYTWTGSFDEAIGAMVLEK